MRERDDLATAYQVTRMVEENVIMIMNPKFSEYCHQSFGREILLLGSLYIELLNVSSLVSSPFSSINDAPSVAHNIAAPHLRIGIHDDGITGAPDQTRKMKRL